MHKQSMYCTCTIVHRRGINPAHPNPAHLEGNGLVGFGSKEEVLPLSVWGLHPLLVGGHEAVPRSEASFVDLRVIHLEE